MTVFRRRRQALALSLLLAISGLSASAADPAGADPFPEPEAIRENVDFWIRIFSEWGVDRLVVHDLQYPAVIYEVVDLPGAIEDRYTDAQKEFAKAVRESWEDYLHALEKKVAGRKRLDDIEKQWALRIVSVVGSDGLRAAHKRVRTQRGLRGKFREGLQRSFRYDARIREIFRDAGLPEDLAFLPHVESSFQYHAKSSAGATGLWQFTRGTGRRYMTINSVIDERLDPIVATRGAANYLREAYDKLGTWPLALTSYNHGVQGMARAKQRFGTDFDRIYKEYDGRLFGFASKNFYAEFLAARTVAGDTDRYFSEGYAPEPSFDLEEVVLRRKMTPSSLARSYGVGVAELASINPAWSRRAVSRGLALPAGTVVWLPPGTSAMAGPQPVGRIDDQGRYVVQRGDTLSSIAHAFGLRLNELRRLNDLPDRGSLIRVGQRLRTGAQVSQHAHEVRKGETLSEIAGMYGTTVRTLREINDISSRSGMIRVGQKLRLPAGIVPVADRQEHVVRRGDTLLRIAARYGVHLMDLLSANTLTVHSIIRPGQILHIPAP